jgi:hypothetical protein
MEKKLAPLLITFIISALPLSTSASSLSAETKNKLLTGELTLNYSLFGKGASGSKDLRALHDANKWDELVESVTAKGFVVNTYYFYLGRAAEEMGAKKAAIKYYEMAIATNKDESYSCTKGGMWDTCAGFKFPDDAVARMAKLKSERFSDIKEYDLNAGPKLTEVIQANIIRIDDLPEANPRKQITKDKFETATEFALRSAKSTNPYLVVSKIKTDDESICQSAYAHDKQVYSVSNCLIYSSEKSLIIKGDQGDSVVLANLFDRREVSKQKYKEIYFDVNLSWSQSFAAPLEVAKSIDSDLYAAVLIDDFEMEKSCSLCDSRASREKMAELIKSVGAIQGKSINTSDVDWKKDAFLSGSITEDWVYRIKPKKVLGYFIFRGKDERILYQAK